MRITDFVVGGRLVVWLVSLKISWPTRSSSRSSKVGGSVPSVQKHGIFPSGLTAGDQVMDGAVEVAGLPSIVWSLRVSLPLDCETTCPV